MIRIKFLIISVLVFVFALSMNAFGQYGGVANLRIQSVTFYPKEIYSGKNVRAEVVIRNITNAPCPINCVGVRVKGRRQPLTVIKFNPSRNMAYNQHRTFSLDFSFPGTSQNDWLRHWEGQAVTLIVFAVSHGYEFTDEREFVFNREYRYLLGN